MSEIIPLFSTPLYRSNIIDLDYDEIYAQISLSNFKRVPDDEVYASTEKYILDVLPNLKRNIIKHLNIYLFEKLQLYPFEYYFPDCWFVKVPPFGGSSIYHMHPNSLYSGVVYIDVPEHGGGINYTYNSNSFKHNVKYIFDVKEYNVYNSEGWIINPDKGDILITPSSTFHKILKNESNKDRHSFAFNILPFNYKYDGFTARA